MKEWLRTKNQLIINDQVVDHELGPIQLSDRAEQWEMEIVDFLNEWFSEKDHIQVQTSGSTGEPKKIRLAKKTMIKSAQDTIRYLGLKKGDSALLCMPARFIGGKMMIVRSIVAELKLHTIKPGSTIRFSSPIDLVAMTPHQVSYTIRNEPRVFDRFKNIIIGGGATDQKLHKELQSVSSTCYASYGMTETSSHIALQKLNGPHQSDHFTVIDPELRIGRDERKCLTILGKQFGEEIIFTNDMVEIIDHKHFIWLGRYDRVINSGGIKLFPEQIEKKLGVMMTHRFFIFAEKHELYQERPALIIETDQEIDLEKILSILQANLSKIEYPVSIYKSDRFIETENGKIMRSESLKVKKRIYTH